MNSIIRSHNSSGWKLASGFLFLLAIPGCSDSRPARVAVAGKVVLDGEPLTKGYVRFFTPGERMAQGSLDEAGRFQLTCYTENDGCVPGVHTVVVSGRETLGEYVARWHAPKKYSDRKSSGLSVNIDGPRDDVLIEISWDGGKPFTEHTAPQRGKRGEAEGDIDI